METFATRRRAKGLRGWAWVALAVLGCAPSAPPDRLALLCADVLDLHHLSLADPRWRVASRRGTERTLHFEARRPDGVPVTDTIRCVFEQGEPWRLERGVIGGHILTEAEVALVNSDLLLRDLSEKPEAPDGSRRAS